MLAEAVQSLAEMHKEFPFKEGRLDALLAEYGTAAQVPPNKWPRSYRVHVACMIAIAGGAMIPKGVDRIGFAYNANGSGSGKTLLGKITVIPIYREFEGRTWPVNDRKKTDESEIRKNIDATALEATPYIVWDNCKGQIASEALEAFMTSHIWKGRIMGGQTTFRAEHSTTVIINGNDLSLSTDNMRRFLMCDLYVEDTEAQDRDIAEPIEARWIIKQRHDIRSAIFAIIKHWMDKQQPRPTGHVRRGFETWSNIIGGIVEAAGLGNLFEPRLESETSGSKDDTQMRKLASHCMAYLSYHTREARFTFQEIIDLCYEHGLFEFMLDGKEERNGNNVSLIPNPSTRASFGTLLKKYAPINTGRVWHFPPDTDAPYVRTLRLQSQGEGRSRRFIATLEFKPTDELRCQLHHHNVNPHEWTALSTQLGLPHDLETLDPEDLQYLNLNLPILITNLRA
jgi:hypothetical protein